MIEWQGRPNRLRMPTRVALGRVARLLNFGVRSSNEQGSPQVVVCTAGRHAHDPLRAMAVLGTGVRGSVITILGAAHSRLRNLGRVFPTTFFVGPLVGPGMVGADVGGREAPELLTFVGADRER